MKAYPSIPKITAAGNVFWLFDKIDGSNMRFEWNKKKGFFKYGTRTRLFDETDPMFGSAVALWNATHAEAMVKVARDSGWESAVFFAEFFGPGSFAGQHVPNAPKSLYLIDIAPYKKGILGPEEFIKHAESVLHAPYLGRFAFNADLIEKVRLGAIPGITTEGVIGKRGEGHKLEMVKIKTQEWMDRVRALYTVEEAERLLAS